MSIFLIINSIQVVWLFTKLAIHYYSFFFLLFMVLIVKKILSWKFYRSGEKKLWVSRFSPKGGEQFWKVDDTFGYTTWRVFFTWGLLKSLTFTVFPPCVPLVLLNFILLLFLVSLTVSIFKRYFFCRLALLYFFVFVIFSLSILLRQHGLKFKIGQFLYTL